MSRRGRGSTRTGRPALLPDTSLYRPPSSVLTGKDAAGNTVDGGLVVEFRGEDKRQTRLRIDRLPLPGWHQPVAAALAARIGPGGGRRTLASARDQWYPVARMLRFLDSLPAAPATPGELTTTHLEAFRRHRRATTADFHAGQDVQEIGRLLDASPLRELTSAEVREFCHRRLSTDRGAPTPGYSDREFRQLVRAARTDVAAIRDRLRASEHLLERYHATPDELTETERGRAVVLDQMAVTGSVPWPGVTVGEAALTLRRELARDLFLTRLDLALLLVLFVAVTGRNIETIKELPIEHRIVDDRAVEVRLLKRRRGVRRWLSTATWEIGPPHRQLHTAGGLYLLLHELTRRSRGFSDSRLLWAIWRHDAGESRPQEHVGPFDQGLAIQIEATSWGRRHGLTADPPSPSTPESPSPPGEWSPAASTPSRPPTTLSVNFRRLKTSVEVRRTKQLGGHLPSAVITNTIPVLFRNYLRGDPTVQEWAEDVVGDALVDAEHAALAAHQHALRAAGGRLAVIGAHAMTADSQPDGVHNGMDNATGGGTAGGVGTAWSACRNHDAHPATGQPCRVTFLDCFHCGNCIITRDHLPRLLSLLDALATRRDQLSEQEWWIRYGMVWAAIRHDVLTKFTPSEVEHAHQIKTPDALLELVENPWERP